MAVDDHRRTGHFPGRLLPRCPPFLHCDGQRLSSRFGKGALLDWHQSLGGRCLGCRRKFLTFRIVVAAWRPICLEITGPPEAKAATRSFSADKCTVAANLYAGGPGAPQTLVAAANLDCIREIRRYPRLAKHEFKKDLCLRVHFVVSINF
jgi:hypothetical protein